MKLRMVNGKYIDVDFWSYMKFHFVGQMLMTLAVYTFFFLIGLFIGLS